MLGSMLLSTFNMGVNQGVTGGNIFNNPVLDKSLHHCPSNFGSMRSATCHYSPSSVNFQGKFDCISNCILLMHFLVEEVWNCFDIL